MEQAGIGCILQKPTTDREKNIYGYLDGCKSGLGWDELDWDGICVGPNLLDWEPPGGANKWIGLGWMGLDGFWVGC